MQNQILNGIPSNAVTPQLNYSGIIRQLKQSMMNNMLQMLLLKNQGVITNKETLDFMNNMKEMYEANSPGIAASVKNESVPSSGEVQNPYETFKSQNPDFFTKYGRKEVLEYIRNFDLDKDEIPKIAKIIESLEHSAIDGYLKQSEHDKIKNDENSAAKSKLTSYAQDAKFDSNNNKIFTRADLGKMSDEDFAKNEKIIFEQLKRGLLQ